MKSKIIWTIIVVLSYFVLIILAIFEPKFDSKMVEKITYIFPLTCSLVIYGYNQWNWLFLLWRKIVIIFRPITVSWNISKKFYVDYGFSFEKFNNKMYNELKDDSSIHIKKFNPYDETLIIEFEKKGLPIKTKIYYDKSLNNQIKLEVTTSSSYKDTKTIEEIIFSLFESITKNVPEYKNISSDINAKISKEVYSVEISLSRYNPFYNYIVRHVSNNETPKFKKMVLTSDDKKTNIEIFNRKMKITSTNQEVIKKIINNYIPISTIG